MTDLEIICACGRAMGLSVCYNDEGTFIEHFSKTEDYNPLKNDAQAMALLKRFKPPVRLGLIAGHFLVGWVEGGGPAIKAESAELNRAICECVAKMMAA